MSYKDDEKLIRAAIEAQEKYIKRFSEVMRDFNHADAGVLFRQLLDAWKECFKNNLVDCEEKDVRLWRGALITLETLRIALDEAEAFANMMSEEEELAPTDALFGFDTRGL
jgi:hypothetical protein